MYIFERKINYYETDKMGVVHHSNYIRYFEEARCAWLEDIGLPVDLLEKNGITTPVLGFSTEYKHHVTFGDTIVIKLFIKEYTSVRMTVGYEVPNKETGELVNIAESKHCFTTKELKPISLKRAKPEFDEKIRKIL